MSLGGHDFLLIVADPQNIFRTLTGTKSSVLSLSKVSPKTRVTYCDRILIRDSAVHVMDQLRNVPFKRPPQAYPWDPLRGQSQPSKIVEDDYFSSTSNTATPNSDTGETTPTARTGAMPGSSVVILSPETQPLTEGNLSSLVGGDVNPLEWHAKISAETVKNRGHPNICKMLDFFEDREFYYRE